MGARQRAQARAKRASGGHRLLSWASNQANGSVNAAKHQARVQAWQDHTDSSSPHRNGTFSMSQEARNTERHTMGWGPTKLREKSVAFVSAGNLVRDEADTVQEDENVEGEADTTEAEDIKEQDSTGPILESPVEVDTTQVAVAVSPAPPSVQPLHPPKYLSRRTSASSQSSEEIVFCGRQNRSTNGPSGSTSAKPTPIRGNSPADNKANATSPRSLAEEDVSISQWQEHTHMRSTRPTQSRNKPSGRRGRAYLRYQREREEEEALMRDYIENLAVDDDSAEDESSEEGAADDTDGRNEHYRFFDGSAQMNEKVQIASAKGAVKGDIAQAIDWDSADLEDFDGLSTTDEEVLEISQVLRHRIRPSGPQYLVTASGQGANEARWVLQEKLVSASAREEIRIFEEIRSMNVEEDTEESDTESETDDALEDLVGDIESEDEENARILERTSRMTDEQIARALAKQEELGLGGDELLLFDGEAGDDTDERDEFAADRDFIPFSAKKHLSNRGKSKRNSRRRDVFPPAEAFADALEQDPYGAFDIMDFERPSLRPKKKGRKSDFPFDLGLEDEELAEHLGSTWSKDREKKAARKREKQAAREAALLDASERNDPASIKAEIRQFLVDDEDTLALAPMDSATRASVHRLAKALRLKSHSEGKEGQGAGRYPVLTKGPQTPRFTSNTIWEVDALMNQRKFFPKHGGGSYRGPNAPRTAGAARARRGGGGALSGATYSNGEVVGASAPEIGADNKGRAILEKMGWTSGMGIGAVGNKGGLEAIKHVVKTTRAGLG
ncbi:hypothetical protein ABEF93_005389 [Exophiala dermatitidis]